MTSGNREHFKSSRVINLQPAQAMRLVALDTGASGKDDGSGRNLGIAGRNLLIANYKLGADADARVDTLASVDYQAMIDADWKRAGSSGLGQTCAVQNMATKLVMGSTLVLHFFPDTIVTQMADKIAAHKARLQAATSETAHAEAAQRKRDLVQRSGLEDDTEDEKTLRMESAEPTPKRFKVVDGVKTEIEPPLTPDEQSAVSPSRSASSPTPRCVSSWWCSSTTTPAI